VRFVCDVTCVLVNLRVKRSPHGPARWLASQTRNRMSHVGCTPSHAVDCCVEQRLGPLLLGQLKRHLTRCGLMLVMWNTLW